MLTFKNRSADPTRTSLWRSRWAAIGAAIAVSLGAGGMLVAQAAPGPAESTIVAVTPERILDTRDPNNLGLPGPFVSPIAQKLQVTGSVPTATGPKVVVPTGATGVLLNVTAVGATANGFISIRPGDATGAPTTSSLNVTAGVTVPNSVQVSLPTAGTNAGKIDITWDALGVAGPTTDILIDVVGYTTNTGLQQLVADVATKANAADVYTKAQLGAGYFKQNSAFISWGPANTNQTVMQLDLPAGSYIVTAKVGVNNNAVGSADVTCSLRLGTTVIDDLINGVFLPPADPDRTVFALASGGTLAAAGTASLVCRSTATVGNYFAPSITAIQVATLTGSVTATDADGVSATGE
jgi:hypothetical protein